MSYPALRLTPSNSPFFKNTPPRSPTKNRNEEPGLRLSKAIGTTTTSANGFACLPSARKFAYTAGAAAVVAQVNDDLQVQQRFFKARPTLAGTGTEASGHVPATPTPNESRNRTLGHAKDRGLLSSPLGAPGRDWSDSPTGRSTTAKDRVKSATSVALSPNGKWLAVGETGYKPRILIFSLADGADDAPVTVLSEHTFGVHALIFSPDSAYLATLGAVNDGYLFVWSIDDRNGTATLHASNKCTTTVHSMAWTGQALVTVGLRFVKVWRPDDDVGVENRRVEPALSPHTPRNRAENRSAEFNNSILSPRHKPLYGKNCLLGDLLEGNFIAVLPLPDSRAIVCAQSGEVCILDDSGTAPSFTSTVTADCAISAARMDDCGNLHVMGVQGQKKTFSASDIDAEHHTPRKQDRRKTISPVKANRNAESCVIATATVGDSTVEIRSGGSITVSDSTKDKAHQLSAHNGPVLGVSTISSDNLPNAAFHTFSASGEICVWGQDGEPITTVSVQVEGSSEDIPNELKAVTAFAKGALLACGDKYGTLTIIDIATGDVIQRLRAHSAEITDICAFTRQELDFLATSSRDRTVQLFLYSNAKLELVQTLDEHAGAVTGLMVLCDGASLLSSSADRSVVVREAILRKEDDHSTVAYAMTRAVTLRSAPTAMCAAEDDNSIWVSTTDRNISKYSISTGQAGFAFKCSDPEGGEAVVMSKILYVPSLNGNPTIVGVASSDKSVRLYTEYGTLIARDWGHTEGVTGLALLPGSQADQSDSRVSPMLVTCAADSTIFIWDTDPSSSGLSRTQTDGLGSLECSASKPALGPPLRKVISHSELSRYKRRVSGGDEADPPSPTTQTARHPASPHRLRKKTSRMGVAQAPKLEPNSRTTFADPKRRRSLRQRSPSPPSPRNTAKKDRLRRPSLGMSLRSKSSENVLNTLSSGGAPSTTNTNSGFGSLTASTKSACRTLRTYRKKLINTNDKITPESQREIEKELKLTLRVLSEKSQGKSLDEAMMARLLDQATEKLVGMLDERIKETVESEVKRRSSEGSPAGAGPYLQSAAAISAEAIESGSGSGSDESAVHAVAGAMEDVRLGVE
jgi:mitogen-activated protein kinase binding protein 1